MERGERWWMLINGGGERGSLPGERDDVASYVEGIIPNRMSLFLSQNFTPFAERPSNGQFQLTTVRFHSGWYQDTLVPKRRWSHGTSIVRMSVAVNVIEGPIGEAMV